MTLALDTINIGAAPNDHAGDSARAGAQKINANFAAVAAASDSLLAASLTDYINVLSYGADRTGVASSAQAFVDAINQAAATNGTLYIPNGKYLLGATGLVVPANVSVVATGHAALIYTGTGVALNIMGQMATQQTRTLRLPAVMRSYFGLAGIPEWHSSNATPDTTSVGVQLTNCLYEQVLVPAIYRFRRGLVLRAIGSAAAIELTVCNTIQLGRIFNNFIGIDFEADAGVGCNSNTFFGGVVNINANAAMAGTISVRMSQAENNVNSFYGTNFEAGGQEKALNINSYGNMFVNCRYEGGHAKAGFLTFGAGSGHNKVIGYGPAGGITVWHTMIADTGQANQYQFGNMLSSKNMTIQFDGAAPIKFGSGNAAPAVPIGGYGTNRLWIGDANTAGIRHFGAVWQETKTVTAGTTIPAGASYVTINNASAATITGASGGAQSDVQGKLLLMDVNGNQTLLHTAAPSSGQGRFVLKAGANLVMSAKVPVQFMLHDGNYYQV